MRDNEIEGLKRQMFGDFALIVTVVTIQSILWGLHLGRKIDAVHDEITAVRTMIEEDSSREEENTDALHQE